jgi:hypothetical protein
MDERPLEANRRYLLKHTSHTVPAFISSIAHRTNIATLGREPASTLEMNAIGVVHIEVLRPIALDLYSHNRATGAFILIDPETNHTVAAGMVRAAGAAPASVERVSAEERARRWGHRGGALELSGPQELIDAVERTLFAIDAVTFRIEADALSREVGKELIDIGILSGLLALVIAPNNSGVLTAQVANRQIVLASGDIDAVVSAVLDFLADAGILTAQGKAKLP